MYIFHLEFGSIGCVPLYFLFVQWLKQWFSTLIIHKMMPGLLLTLRVKISGDKLQILACYSSSAGDINGQSECRTTVLDVSSVKARTMSISFILAFLECSTGPDI